MIFKEADESDQHDERAYLGQYNSTDNLVDVFRPFANFSHEENQVVQVVREQDRGEGETCHIELGNAVVLNQIEEQLGRQHNRVSHQQVQQLSAILVMSCANCRL